MSRSYWTYKQDRDNDYKKDKRDNNYKKNKRYSSAELLQLYHKNEDVDLPENRYGWGKDEDAAIMNRKLVKRVFLKLGNARAAIKRLHEHHAKSKRNVEVTLALGDVVDLTFGKNPRYAFDEDVFIEGEKVIPNEQIKFVNSGTRKIRLIKFNQYEHDMGVRKYSVEHRKDLVKRRYEVKYWINRLAGSSEPLFRTHVRNYRNELIRIDRDIKKAEEKVNDIDARYRQEKNREERRSDVHRGNRRGPYRVHRVR